MGREINLNLTKDLLRDIFIYRDGILYWKDLTDYHCRNKIGDIAGAFDKKTGYERISLFGVKFQTHRLIWIYHNGDIPEDMTIDHKDLNKINNDIFNLRLATRAQQRYNSKTRIDNICGLKGVYFHNQSKKWTAQGQLNGKRVYLGRFSTKEEAKEAYESFMSNNEFHRS
jgi:hypothetical protein